MARSRKPINQTCYMCDREAVSREHFPPKCFYPEEKDQKWSSKRSPKNFRTNFDGQTVPACSEHNLQTSMDDEYLLAILFAHIENDQYLQTTILHKIMRAIERRPALRSFYANNPINIEFKNQPAVAITIDFPRIQREIEKIARAAYNKTFNEKWTLDLEVYSPALLAYHSQDSDVFDQDKNFIEYIDAFSKRLLGNNPKHGSYPEIFYFQIFRNFYHSFLLIRMVFYKGFRVLALSSSKDLIELAEKG